MGRKGIFRNIIITIVMVGFAMSLLIGIAGAVAPNEEWNKTYGGISADLAYSVQQTSDDGYVFAGYTTSYGAGYQDACVKMLG